MRLTNSEKGLSELSTCCAQCSLLTPLYHDYFAILIFSTFRVVRISCTSFPKYFAILSRIKEEVRAIGADGGKIVANHAPNIQAFFPSGMKSIFFQN